MGLILNTCGREEFEKERKHVCFYSQRQYSPSNSLPGPSLVSVRRAHTLSPALSAVSGAVSPFYAPAWVLRNYAITVPG